MSRFEERYGRALARRHSTFWPSAAAYRSTVESFASMSPRLEARDSRLRRAHHRRDGRLGHAELLASGAELSKQLASSDSGFDESRETRGYARVRSAMISVEEVVAHCQAYYSTDGISF